MILKTLEIKLKLSYTDFMNKNLIIVAVLCLVIGAAVGYYFGYDIGWERAVDYLQK